MRAASVASQVAGGRRQLSQAFCSGPHGGLASPK